MKDLGDSKPIENDLSQSERIALDGIVWKKFDALILPLCTGLFLLAYLDRTNIGNARIAGLQNSLAMTNYQYTVVITVTFIPYIAVEFPVTLFSKVMRTPITVQIVTYFYMAYVGPHRLIPTMVTLWGVACAAQGLVKSYSGLLICRFFLGLFEGGLFPCIVLYLSSFYPRKWLQTRIAVFYTASALSGAFSGLLAAAIDLIDGKGGKPGWAWIFILEGIFTFIFGVISFLLLPRSPETVPFLTDKEREYVVSTLKHTGTMSEDASKDRFSWMEVAQMAKSPHVWLLAIVCFLNGTMLFGLAYFEPTIVSNLGYKGNQAQLMSVPPFAAAFVLSSTLAILSDRYQCRGSIAIVASLLLLLGMSMFHTSKSNHVRYGSLFFSVFGTYCVQPTLFTWLANNSTPHVRRAAAIATGSILTQSSGILATWLLGTLSSAPNYVRAMTTFIAMSACMVVLLIVNLVYLGQANRLKAEKRQRMTKEEESERLGDRSAWFMYSL